MPETQKVAGGAAVVEQGLFAAATLPIFLEGLLDPRFVEAQHLVVVGVGELVQDDPGLLIDVSPRGQVGINQQRRENGYEK